MIYYIVIISLIILFAFFVYPFKNIVQEPFSTDEAIQNIASLYNKDELTIEKINSSSANVSGILKANQLFDVTMGSYVKEYIDSKISAAEQRVMNRLTSEMSQTIKKQNPVRIKSLSHRTIDQYGPYLRIGDNHDQSLWRDPKSNHSENANKQRFSFVLEQ